MKCIETHVNAVACVPMHFRHQTNIQFSVVGQFNAVACVPMHFRVRTSDKYTIFGGRPVHWPTTKKYMFDSCF